MGLPIKESTTTMVNNMRKIEKEMLAAINSGVDWKKDNTHVKVNNRGVVEVYLHDNFIASINRDGFITLTSAGWETATTKSRLNAICSNFNLPGIYQSKGVWYQGKDEEFINYGMWDTHTKSVMKPSNI